jgi:hypothetical protein
VNIPCHSALNERGFSDLKEVFELSRANLSDESIKSLYFLRWFYKKAYFINDE